MGKKIGIVRVDEVCLAEASVLPQEQRSPHPTRLAFSNATQRAKHIEAFQEWLPKPLHNAPDIFWDQLPSEVMGYLIRHVADSPDSIPIALAVACALHGIKKKSLAGYCRALAILLRRLRTQYGMRELADLRTRHIWDSFVGERVLSGGEVRLLTIYDSLASIHEPAYLEDLNEHQRIAWKRYMLPSLPIGFLEKHGLTRAATASAQKRRREQSDVLVPLFPVLVEIAQFRKQAAERLIKEFRRQRDRAVAGEIELPHHFEYKDHLISVTEDATTLAEALLIEREVILSFTLWDRASWADKHPERYQSRTSRFERKRKINAYAPERNIYFLQYQGSPGDLLWCGDLLANRRLGRGPRSTSRKHLVDTSTPGTSKWFSVSRPALLSPKRSDKRWLDCAVCDGEVLFEPESLYRGCLYATALATLALTNGSRVNELLQVSATRFETLVVDELKNQQPTGRKIGILVQYLLPKGYTRESERQFFLISEMAAKHLTEIGLLLEETHGGSIPVVQPYKSRKSEDLASEPYLFQWETSDDGRLGLLPPEDVSVLLRFLYHGLSLTTRTGQSIQIVPHLLRHVLATHARTVKNIPAEAVAYLLHHRVILSGSSYGLTVSEATAYYSRMPVEQVLALLFEAQSTLASYRDPAYLQVPLPHTLEGMDATLRRVFEQWGMIGPTALGYCSAGLCIRPNNRALCLNCPHLVPHYSNLPNARIWRKLYILQTQLHDSHGHHVDAQQARQMVLYIDDIIRVMEIQIRARQDGGYLPFVDTLPPVQGEEGEH